MRPPPKREQEPRTAGCTIETNPTNDCKDVDSHSVHVSGYYCSKYWNAHAKRELPKGLMDSNSNSRFSNGHHDIGIQFEGAASSLKKAKLACHSKPHAKTCKGSCPALWTIEQYCEQCHS